MTDAVLIAMAIFGKLTFIFTVTLVLGLARVEGEPMSRFERGFNEVMEPIGHFFMWPCRAFDRPVGTNGLTLYAIMQARMWNKEGG